MTRVDHGDGTFSYVPPPGLSYADQVGNHFTWRYVGQAVHSDAPQPILGVTEYVDGVDIPDDPSEGVAGLLGATRVDGYGRIWEIVAIDSPALDGGNAGGNADDNSGSRRKTTVVNLVDEVPQHLLCDVEVCDDTVTKRTDGLDV